MLKYLFLFIPLASFSQIIKGSIKNDSNEAIFGVSVVITKLSSKEIIAYDISDSDGNFSIKINSLIPKLKISVRILGYKEQFKLIDYKTKNINFILTPEITKLKEVIVNADKITKNKDTINYRVSSFANKKDRSIGDVIAKMPGIEILPNGKILYQGKPINKYYIEGLDLLEGKYNLANNNLPFNKVYTVQILENHQPIKILDSLVFSDKAALNIKLKNNVSLTGQVELGIGTKPLLYENNITPMLFSKQGQIIGSYQTNNTGKDIASQLEVLTSNNTDNNLRKNWVSSQKKHLPNLSSKKWLNNNTHIISFNYLSKLKNKYNLRLNISYLNDFQKQKLNKKTFLFINKDTVEVFEESINKIYNNSLKSNLSIEKNTKKSFLKNSFKFQGLWNSERTKLNINNNILSEVVKPHFFEISNKFNNIFLFNKQLIEFNSYVSYQKKPQTLNIEPGQFINLLNNNNSYVDLKQKIDLNKFYTKNSISFTKNIGEYTFTSKLGFLLNSQKLKSNINVNDFKLPDNKFNNKLQWLHGSTFFNVTSHYRKNQWQIQIKAPLAFNYFNIEDRIWNKGEKLKKLIFSPRLSSTFDINSFWKLENSFEFKNSFGKINDIYYSYIVKNSRAIYRINSPIPKLFSQKYNSGFSYRNQLSSLFGYIYYTFSNSKKNILHETKISSNGSIEINAISKDNTKSSHAIHTKISKYISEIKTSFFLKMNFSNNRYKQILNNHIVSINNNNYTFKLKGNTDIYKWFSIEYQGSLSYNFNKIIQNYNSSFTNQNYFLKMNFHPGTNQFIGLNSDLFINDLFSNKRNTFFTDLVYRYSLKTKKIDFELIYNNVFNTQSYQTINLNNFSKTVTNFEIRPSQIVLKAKFSL